MVFASSAAFRESYKTMVLMRCDICTEDFNDDHKPVILKCSHSFCSTCLTKITVSRNKRCPVCRQEIQVDSSKDFIINRSLLDLVNYLKKKKGPQMPSDPAEDVWKMAEESGDRWEQAEKEIQEVAGINKDKIAELRETNALLTNDLKVKLERIEMENYEVMQKLEGYNVEMERVRKLVNDVQAVVSVAKERAKRAKSFAEYGRIKDDVRHMIKSLQNSIKVMMADISANKALHQKMKKDTNIKLMQIQEILRLIPDTDVVTGGLNTYRCITVNDLKRTTGEVFAVKIINGRRRYAKIVKSDQNGRMLQVHRLKDEPSISPDAQFIKYEEITELTHYCDRLTFMDLGSRGKVLVRIVIKYYNEMNFIYHVRNHILLCTGERGPSYVNSKVFKVCGKGRSDEFLLLGDFERNDGTAGRAIVSSKEAGEWWKHEGSTGMLCTYLCQHGSTEATASQFSILTQKYYGAKIFAYVKEGLSTLRSVIQKCSDVREIEIMDCGRVVYC